MYNIVVRSNDIRVVNCTSSDLNGINHLDLFNLILKHSRENPSEHTMLYPNFYMPDNKIVHAILHKVHAAVPAYLADWRSSLLGRTPTEVQTLNIIQISFELGIKSVIDHKYDYIN